MIDSTLIFIRDILNSSIQETIHSRVELGNIALVDAFQEVSSLDLTNKIVVSLINIEEEKTLKNAHSFQTTTQPNGEVTVSKRRPPIYLNLYVLFAANDAKYENALHYLSRIIGFFQKQNVFEAQAYPQLSDARVERLVFDLYSLRFEELNQVWSVLGGKYIPSVLYRVRLVAIQEAPDVPTAIITKTRSEETVLW